MQYARQPRCAARLQRIGDGENDEARARLSLALMLTLRGTPFLYNGEEIGMRNLLLDDPTLFRDCWASGVTTWSVTYWIHRTMSSTDRRRLRARPVPYPDAVGKRAPRRLLPRSCAPVAARHPNYRRASVLRRRSRPDR